MGATASTGVLSFVPPLVLQEAGMRGLLVSQTHHRNAEEGLGHSAADPGFGIAKDTMYATSGQSQGGFCAFDVCHATRSFRLAFPRLRELGVNLFLSHFDATWHGIWRLP